MLKGVNVFWIRYSKSYEGLYNTVLLWVNRDALLKNRLRYSSYCGRSRNNGSESLCKADVTVEIGDEDIVV
jgi:hypothetical protein